MVRFLGILVLVVGVGGAVVHRFADLHHYANDAVRYFWGPSATETFGSPVGEGVIYLLFYFIAVVGLVLIAAGRRKSLS